ncbi:MAG: MATE family efflux transporter, partial [Phycisphaerales bacterium]
MPMCGIMMVGAMCLHGAGETTMPSLIAIVVNFVNIVVSWILSGADFTIGDTTYINPFTFDMHVMGIAAGTAVSYAMGALLTIWVLMRGVKDLRLTRGSLSVERIMTGRIIRVGVPNFFEGISMWAVNLFVLMFLGIIATASAAGEGMVGAHVIAIQWEALSFMPGFAIGTAAGALAGQYLGAGNPRMARKAVLTCTAIGVVVMVSIGVVFMLFGEELTRFLSRDPIHLKHVPRLLLICGSMQCFFAITLVVRQSLRGSGDTKWTFIITSASSYGVRLPAAYLLGVHFGYGIEGVWIALCGELIVRSILFSARFIHGGWQRVRV